MTVGEWEVEVVKETVLVMDKADSTNPVTNLMIDYSFYHRPTRLTFYQTITWIKKRTAQEILEHLKVFVVKLKASHIDTLDRRLPNEVFNRGQENG